MTHFDEIEEKIHLLKNDPETLNLFPPKKKEYVSITKVIGEMSASKASLLAWRNRIGEEEANNIMKVASTRGTKVHSLIEMYFKNIVEETDNQHFQSIKPVLEKITPIELELSVWSHRFKLTGRIDCIGYFDNQLSIIDFKTSNKRKKEEWIFDYYLQTTMYSMLLSELLNIHINNIVIIIALENDIQIFIKKVSRELISNSLMMIKQYKNFQLLN